MTTSHGDHKRSDLVNRLTDLPQTLLSRLLKNRHGKAKIGFQAHLVEDGREGKFTAEGAAELTEDEKSFIETYAMLSVAMSVAKSDGKVLPVEMHVMHSYVQNMFEDDEFEEVAAKCEDSPYPIKVVAQIFDAYLERIECYEIAFAVALADNRILHPTRELLGAIEQSFELDQQDVIEARQRVHAILFPSNGDRMMNEQAALADG